MNNKTKKNRNIYGGSTGHSKKSSTDDSKKSSTDDENKSSTDDENKSSNNKLDKELYIYKTTQISTDRNIDPNYKKIGIVHYSDSAGINIAREFGTGLYNVFGARGFDNKIHDNLRKSTLDKIKGLLTENQIICSCRMEFDVKTVSTTMIIHHFYGTLYEKR
jgi:hypothetical protein